MTHVIWQLLGYMALVLAGFVAGLWVGLNVSADDE